jgi:hypothetical protein
MAQFSPLQNARADYKPKHPAILNNLNRLHPMGSKECGSSNPPLEIGSLFPMTHHQKKVGFSSGSMAGTMSFQGYSMPCSRLIRSLSS